MAASLQSSQPYKPNYSLLQTRNVPNPSAIANAMTVACSYPIQVSTNSSIGTVHASNYTTRSSAAPATPSLRDDDGLGEPDKSENHEIFTSYIPQLDGPEHPSKLIVTTTLSFAMPKIDPQALHPSLWDNRAISAAQRDAVALIRTRHMSGQGFLLGDSTGVGKGRMLAATMLNHLRFSPDCKKFIIVTASRELIEDFHRDLKEIGWPLRGKNALPLLSVTEYTTDANSKIPFKKGVAFLTYRTLISRGSKGTSSRIDQLIKWCGGKHADSFKGVVAFDEIHSAKDPRSQTSWAVNWLQQVLSNAAVVYSSATSISSVSHLCALPGLQLWDTPTTPGATAYPSFEAFRQRWRSQSRSTLELLTSELAAKGAYIARRLSFEGTKFDVATAEFTVEQEETHTRLSEWWLSLSKQTQLWSGTGPRNSSFFWGTHLRFFKALLIAFRVKFCAEQSKKALESARSVVISLIGTGEAAAKRTLAAAAAAADDNDNDNDNDNSLGADGFVALRETLLEVLASARENLTTADFTNESDRRAVGAMLDKLREQVPEFNLPPSPLDLLIHELKQIGEVVEMTGRSGGFYRNSEDGRWSYEARTVNNVSGCRLFQTGKANICVISTAASVGISLHDTATHPVSRPRVMFLLELPWRADQSFQTTGRVQRANEHSSPTYCLITSNLEAEKRFAATVAKRAADLGAGTTGDRRGAIGNSVFGSDTLVGSDAQEGMRRMFLALSPYSQNRNWPRWCAPIPGKDWSQYAQTMRSILRALNVQEISKPKQLLGRLLGIPKELSNGVFHLYQAACVDAMVETAKKQVDVGVEDLCIGGVNGTTRVARISDAGAITISTDVGISFKDARKRAAEWQEEGGRWKFFVREDNIVRNRSFTVLALLNTPRVTMYRPNGRMKSYYVADFQDLQYKSINDASVAEKLWNEEYEASLTICAHGPTCRSANCITGKRHVFSILVKMPGAFGALCGSNNVAKQQIVRIKGSLTASEVTEAGGLQGEASEMETCVALRLGSNAQINEELLEQRLAEQRKRDEVERGEYVATKQKVLDELDRATASATACRTRSIHEMLLSSSDNDSDSDVVDWSGACVVGDDIVAPASKKRAMEPVQTTIGKKEAVVVSSDSESSSDYEEDASFTPKQSRIKSLSDSDDEDIIFTSDDE